MKESDLPRLREIIANVIGANIEDLQPEMHLEDDMGIDSLEMVELVMEIEKEFNITFEDSEIEDIRTMADLERVFLKTGL